MIYRASVKNGTIPIAILIFGFCFHTFDLFKSNNK